MIKYYLLSAIALLSGLKVFSQERRDLGLQFGSTYYIGDYNINSQFYKPTPALGVLFKYNLNNFYSLRISAVYGGLKGEYNQNGHYLPGNTGSFQKRIIELNAMGEINFLAFDTREHKKEKVSPYFIAGLGAAYLNDGFIIHFPFGFGMKFSASNRIAVGFEWRFHKTISDKIDNYQNVNEGKRTFLHNNDWFSFGGVFLTYRLYNYSNSCPAYQ